MMVIDGIIIETPLTTLVVEGVFYLLLFFKEGKALFWYDKTGGKIEFFTKGGKHPTNGKVLRPAIQKIIRKYVFGEE
ncbi:hypothetical protein D1816_03600 [Aquimarina sp. AD10]|uniref:hypothetical protein n=1 Tax=Aquimarina sp. AD10 TaxID=1714849 RepID=UPI000E538A41|nr:hypothetical protein [Aquimarina sp. AD10]AXT59474.1 hypothetical protein D1816_03600 [Aquimarina sp. AD10]RKN00375.1 hypothetical protein D7033_08430 [Aquimarina sp. AD10]